MVVIWGGQDNGGKRDDTDGILGGSLSYKTGRIVNIIIFINYYNLKNNLKFTVIRRIYQFKYLNVLKDQS